jgi:hypothetical protein
VVRETHLLNSLLVRCCVLCVVCCVYFILHTMNDLACNTALYSLIDLQMPEERIEEKMRE